MDQGHRIRHLREARGWSIAELARRAGVSGPYVGMLEKGEREGKREKLEAIAGALDVTYAALVAGEDAIPATAGVPIAGHLTELGDLRSNHAVDLMVNRKGRGGLKRGVSQTTTFDQFVSVPDAKGHWWALEMKLPEPVSIDWAGVELRDGDLVVMDPDIEPEDGRLVAGLWRSGKRSKLKAWRQLGDVVMLYPVWPEDEIEEYVKADWFIAGVSVGLWRTW